MKCLSVLSMFILGAPLVAAPPGTSPAAPAESPPFQFEGQVLRVVKGEDVAVVHVELAEPVQNESGCLLTPEVTIACRDHIKAVCGALRSGSRVDFVTVLSRRGTDLEAVEATEVAGAIELGSGR